jgi:hypothetical protein
MKSLLLKIIPQSILDKYWDYKRKKISSELIDSVFIY